MSKPIITIIGAGVSGLVCAIELERAGFSPVIFEKAGDVGGRLQTDIFDGYPLDHGFQVLLTAYPAARRYLDYDNLDLRSFKPGAKLYGNGWTTSIGDFLRDPSFLLPTLTTRAVSTGDKLRMFNLSRSLRTTDAPSTFSKERQSTLEYLQNAGFSKKAIDRFFRPFYGGIFLESDLSTPAALFEFTFQMFATGSAALPAKGIQEIARDLQRQLKATEIHFNSEVVNVSDKGVMLESGEYVSTDYVIYSAIPASVELSSQLKKSDAPWKGCTTHYFKTEINNINAPIIALMSAEDTLVNSFHYVSDLMGRHSDYHLLSVTTLDRGVGDGADQVDRVLKDLKGVGISKAVHVQSFHVPRALPDLEQVKYAPDRGDVRLGQGQYQVGDITANGSLNAAMEAGRVGAEAVIEDVRGGKKA